LILERRRREPPSRQEIEDVAMSRAARGSSVDSDAPTAQPTTEREKRSRIVNGSEGAHLLNLLAAWRLGGSPLSSLA
jgi:hypothetical protein